jgi:ubiquinone/menaquinone biosynthesis C-methylase UbiE
MGENAAREELGKIILSHKTIKISVAEMYGNWGISDKRFYATIDRSLNPRGPDMLFDKMAELKLGAGHQILDIGCRNAHFSCELARRFGARVFAVDPVNYNLRQARRLVKKNRLVEEVQVIQGWIESIPLKSSSVDYIWCRDMLNHVADLKGAFRECARVLKPRGHMLLFVTLATELLELKEARRLYAALAIVAKNMSIQKLERAIQSSGLRIDERDKIDSEWREWGIEQGHPYVSTTQQLLRIARLRRAREILLKKLGRIPYENELANCHWGVYTMLGKLCPFVYVLRKKC